MTFEQLENLKKEMIKSCKICNGNYNEQCECIKQFRFYVQMNYAGIEKEYWDLELKDWKGNETIKHKLENYLKKIDYIAKEGVNFVFFGSHGTGKTFSGILLLKEALRYNFKAYKITLSELLVNIQNDYNLEEKTNIMDKIKDINFLLLDEMGGEYRPADIGKFCIAQCDYLFRHRRKNLLPTIITTNFKDKNEFQKYYGSGIESITETYIWLSILGSDFRRKQIKVVKDGL